MKPPLEGQTRRAHTNTHTHAHKPGWTEVPAILLPSPSCQKQQKLRWSRGLNQLVMNAEDIIILQQQKVFQPLTFV